MLGQGKGRTPALVQTGWAAGMGPPAVCAGGHRIWQRHVFFSVGLGTVACKVCCCRPFINLAVGEGELTPFCRTLLVSPCSADVCELGQDCTQAHSPEELEEWIQRAKVAEKKQKHAKQGGLLAYQARLLAEYHESHNEVLIVSCWWVGKTAGGGGGGLGQWRASLY